jgi:hypothetical protein
MDALHKQITRARRRLVLQSFSAKLAWCWFVTLLVATLAIAVGRVWPPVADERLWASGSLAVALVVGLLAAIAWTWFSRQSALDAAVEIDRRFALKERVASTLSLDADTLQSEAGRALVLDAAARIEQIDLAEQFGVRLDRRALLPLGPALVAMALVLIGGGSPAEKPAEAAPAQAAQIKKSTQALAERLEERRKEAAAQGLPEADALLKQMEAQAKSIPEKSLTDRKQALAQLNELVREAEKRRQELSSGNEMKQQLNQIKNVQAGLADKLANALKKADFQKARQELDKLQQQLAGDKLSEPEKQALAKQIEQMQQSLEKMTEAHKKAVAELREKVDSERKSGNVAEADKLQQQLDKLAQQKPQVDKLDKMAQQLKQASKSMREGDAKQAAAALAKLSNEMAGMEKDMQELATLETALDELADCKNAMACQECDGEGCAACEGNRPSNRWSRSKNAKGQGMGAGEREESKTRTNFFDSQVKQNVGKGASVVTGLADGPNRKGQVQEAIRGDYSDAEQQATEALSDQRLPHDYREHAKAYFDTLREGQR